MLAPKVGKSAVAPAKKPSRLGPKPPDRRFESAAAEQDTIEADLPHAPLGSEPRAAGIPWSFSRISVFPPARPAAHTSDSSRDEETAQSVPVDLRDRFEQRTGRSLAGVRIHTRTASQNAAKSLSARAFTVGQHIHFGEGEFQPGTPDGDYLLAHEMTHTVQQRSAASAPQLSSLISKQEDSAELEADTVADALTDDHSESEESNRVSGHEDAPNRKIPITETARLISLAPTKKKKKKKNTAPKPQPLPFTLFKVAFEATLDPSGKVTVKPKKKADGWTFTSTSSNVVNAERSLDHHEYVAANGTSEQFVQKTIISVPAGGPAVAGRIDAVLGDPSKLTLPLSDTRHAKPLKTVTINGASIKQLDLPLSAFAFTPADGDAIHLGIGGDAWVFSTLKQNPVAPATATTDVKGFFEVGFFTRFVDHGQPTFGIDAHTPLESARQQTFEDLADPSTPAALRLTAEESNVFKTVSVLEADFKNAQTFDRGILSFGFAQWTVASDLAALLSKVDAATFEQYLGRYGLSVGTPVRQLDNFVAKFVPESDQRRKLGVRNKSEGAFFLNSRELVSEALLAMAKTRHTELDASAKTASSLKADVADAKVKLASSNAVDKAAGAKKLKTAGKKIDKLNDGLRHLPGHKQNSDPEKQADNLAAIATKAADTAQEVTDNCDSSEEMRKSEWALRFEMLGQSEGGKEAQLAQARETLNRVKKMTVHGAAFGTLLPNDRGRAALMSSFLNTQVGAESGMRRAVDEFKKQKKDEAKTAAAAATAAKKPAPPISEADWTAFPWPAADKRWTTIWPTVTDDFEALAIVKVTAGTTDANKRRDTIARLFP